MFDEIRTTADIMRDLVEQLQHREWVEHYERCGRGCCGDWSTICESCEAEEGDYSKPDEYRQHKPGCKLAALLLEAETFIRIEDQLAEEREVVNA